MIPEPMRAKHDPPYSFGDCYRAALASITERNDIPHFFGEEFGIEPDDDDWLDKVRAWFSERDMTIISWRYDGKETPLHDVLTTMKMVNPDTYYLTW